jgi:hypothetical protein
MYLNAPNSCHMFSANFGRKRLKHSSAKQRYLPDLNMKALLITGKYHAKQTYSLILDGIIAFTVGPVAFHFCTTSFSRLSYVSTCF